MSKELTTKERVKDIMENHLPTMEKKIAVLDAKVKILLYLASGIGAICVAEFVLGRV